MTALPASSPATLGPGAFTISIDPVQILRVMRELHGLPGAFERTIRRAVNDTTKNLRTKMSADIRGRIVIKKRDLDHHIHFTRVKKSGHDHTATVSLERSSRPGLHVFSARQTRLGVTYRISKTGGRKLARSAFEVQQWNRRVFKRVGKSRLPIVQLKGVSPWGVFVRNAMTADTVRFARERLRINLSQGLRFELLKAQGVLDGRGRPNAGAAARLAAVEEGGAVE